MSEALQAAVARFIALRGDGPYDDATMMEAALLLEEAAGVQLADDQLTADACGDAERLKRFALQAAGG